MTAADGAAEQSPGLLLRQAREHRGWSTQQVASALNLRAAVVEALEQDRAADRNALTFIRGYVRAYARLMALDEQQILTHFDALEGRRAGTQLKNFSQRLAEEARENRLALGSYLLVAVVLLLSLWWWLQERQPTTQAVPVTLHEVDEIAFVPVPRYEPELYSPVPEVMPEPLEQLGQTTASKVSSLQIRCRDYCWLRVDDAAGRQLVLGSHPPGSVLDLSGRPPLRIIAGAAQSLSIVFAGNPVDLSRFSADERLELTLPE